MPKHSVTVKLFFKMMMNIFFIFLRTYITLGCRFADELIKCIFEWRSVGRCWCVVPLRLTPVSRMGR